MTVVEKSTLLNLISQGNIQEAINQLLSMDISESKRKEAIVIASRYGKLKQQLRNGILTFEQSNVTENQIIAHLVDLINHHDDLPFPKEKAIDATNPTQPIIWKYITAAAVIIGILGSLAEVFNLINIFPSKQPAEKHQLTVFVTDTKGNVVLEHEGELNTSIGNRPMRETIGEDGRTNFGDILPEYLGDTITIGFKAEGWEIVDDKKNFVFSGAPIRLTVKKDEGLGTIKGVVRTRDGQGFISGALIRINTDTTVLTNNMGIFKIVLPEKMRVTSASESYDLIISKKGYKTIDRYYFPESNPEIRLEKE